MSDISVIANKIRDLEKLGQKKLIPIDELDAHFHPDLKKFLIGETLPMSQGKPMITLQLFRKWLNKVTEQGFDQEIDFTK